MVHNALIIGSECVPDSRLLALSLVRMGACSGLVAMALYSAIVRSESPVSWSRG